MTVQRSNRRAILFDLETTYNDSTTPLAADAILCRTISMTPLAGNDIQRVAVRPYYGNSPMVAGEKHVELTLEVELVPGKLDGDPAAIVPPRIGKLLRVCGFEETIDLVEDKVVYTPISSAEESGVFFAHMDGNLHRGRGCRGTVSFALNAANLPTATFTLSALVSPVTSTALPAATFEGWVYALPVNTTNTSILSMLGQNVAFNQFSLDVAAQVVRQDIVGANDILITERAPAGAVQVRDPGVAVKDYFNEALTAAVGAITLQHGQVAGSIIEFSMPACGIASPTYADDNGIQMLSMNYTAQPVEGNDEITITFR